ncbi:MAG: PIN domain-containing protein [Myxococcales bacterium]
MGPPSARNVVLDAGTFIAFERGDGRMRALLEAALATGVQIVVPAGAVDQAWRGRGRQALLARLLRDPAISIEALHAETGRACGVLCGRSGTSDVIDASVVLAARRCRGVVVTSDPVDIRRLDADLRIEQI